jgi:hypothetical protein
MAETLIEIIKERVLPGTTIISNCWTACNAFTDEGYTHPNSELENNIH